MWAAQAAGTVEFAGTVPTSGKSVTIETPDGYSVTLTHLGSILVSKGAPVAGCMVTSGRIVKGKVRVRRRKEVIYEGLTQSLRRFQDEVNEVRAGMECGIRIEGFAEFQVGDNIECYTMEKVAQKL